LRDFERALELNPANTAALQNIAHIQSEITHDNQRAIESLTQLIALRPLSATPVASRGIVLARAGHFDEAILDAKVAETLTPNAIEMLQIAGIYALAGEKVDGRRTIAISWLSKAITMDPGLRNLAAADPDLKNLREMEQFRTLTRQRTE
jgi:tetratricopeptide (TPR) repeat protein